MLANQYLAIDYGTSYIKGVLYKESFGNISILRKESLKIVKFGTNESDEYEYNIVRFIQSFFPEESSFVLNLPLEKLFIRDLVIPIGSDVSRFGAQKVILESMPYEVENVVPFPIEEMVVQGNIWKIEKESSMLITFSAHLLDVEKSALPFNRRDTSLRCISTDPYTLSCIPKLFFGKGSIDHYVGQLDIGGKVAIFNLSSKGALIHSRFFAGGGDFITEKIQSLLDLGLEEAEELKHSIHFSIYEPVEEEVEEFRKKYSLKPEQVNSIIEMIRASLKKIAEEVSKSLHTLHGSERPSCIFLSGGASLFKGTDKFLFDLTGIVFRYYDFLELDDPRFINTISIGYHYRVQDNEKINFLTPELAKRLNKSFFRLSSYYPHIILLTISSIILATVFIMGVMLDKKKIEANNQALRDRFKQGFGRELGEEEEPTSAAMAEVNKEKKKSEIVRLFLSKASILDVIYEVSALFPPKDDFNFVLEQFTYDGDGNAVYIDGRVDDFAEIGPIQTALEKSSLIKSIDVQNKRLIQGATKLRVAFKLKLELANMEKSGREKGE
jgi:general secretion pathway protein L